MATEKNDLELYFEWWLNELRDHGYIFGYNREAKTLPLFPNYVAKRVRYFKNKEPMQEEFNFMHGRHYNYDYDINWTEKSRGIFYQSANFSNHDNVNVFTHNIRDVFFVASEYNHILGCDVSLVDVKPPSHGGSGRKNDSYITFPLKQQILLWLHGTYVNKVVPFPIKGSGKTISLFPNTFTPRRFLITDGARQARKISFHVKMLDEYVAIRKARIKEIEDDLKKLYGKENSHGQTKLL